MSGVFTDRRPTPADRFALLPPPPASPFPTAGEFDLWLYDTQTMQATPLESGALPQFSPSGAYLSWAAPTPESRELWVLELASMRRWSLGPGRAARWLDDRTLTAFLPGGNDLERVDVVTGSRSPAGGANLNAVDRPQERSGFRLERVRTDAYPGWRSTYRVIDLSGLLGPLEFDAYRAVLADDGTLVIATVPTSVARPSAPGPDVQSGDSNLFLVDPRSGSATFIASVRAGAPNWPLAASPRYVAWTDGYCGADDLATARARVYDRQALTITEFNRADWLALTPRGELGLGQFGPQALLDIASSRYTFVLPPGRLDVVWSADYRYAARGWVGGHGGLCG